MLLTRAAKTFDHQRPHRLNAPRSLQFRCEKVGSDAFGCTREPAFDEDIAQRGGRDAVEANQDGRVSVKVRRRKEHGRIGGEEHVFRLEIGRANAEDGPGRSILSERRKVGSPERPFPRKGSVPHDPSEGSAARALLARFRQRQRYPPHVTP